MEEMQKKKQKHAEIQNEKNILNNIIANDDQKVTSTEEDDEYNDHTLPYEDTHQELKYGEI